MAKGLFTLIALGLAATSAAAASWEAIDLGALGGRNSYAASVSAGGLVAGCAETADGAIHAFLYQDGALRDLGTGADSAGNSCGLAVNDQGHVAGRSSTGELVVWTASGVTRLGFSGNVGGINTWGVIAGTRTEGASTRAFLYSEGTVTELGAPGERSEAAAINDRGQVAGSANGHAFLYSGGALRDLGTLGGNNSVGRGINTRGEVVGMSSNEFGQPTPFVHRDAMQALPGPAYSAALGINARGQVIGSGEGTHGYLVDGSTVTQLGEIPAVVARGWRNLEPTAINDRGWIVGTAENAEGDLRAFLLKPRGKSKPRRIAQ